MHMPFLWPLRFFFNGLFSCLLTDCWWQMQAVKSSHYLSQKCPIKCKLAASMPEHSGKSLAFFLTSCSKCKVNYLLIFKLMMIIIKYVVIIWIDNLFLLMRKYLPECCRNPWMMPSTIISFSKLFLVDIGMHKQLGAGRINFNQECKQVPEKQIYAKEG